MQERTFIKHWRLCIYLLSTWCYMTHNMWHRLFSPHILFQGYEYCDDNSPNGSGNILWCTTTEEGGRRVLKDRVDLQISVRTMTVCLWVRVNLLSPFPAVPSLCVVSSQALPSGVAVSAPALWPAVDNSTTFSKVHSSCLPLHYYSQSTQVMHVLWDTIWNLCFVDDSSSATLFLAFFTDFHCLQYGE